MMEWSGVDSGVGKRTQPLTLKWVTLNILTISSSGKIKKTQLFLKSC